MSDIKNDIEDIFSSRLKNHTIHKDNDSWEKISIATKKRSALSFLKGKQKYLYIGIIALGTAAVASPFVSDYSFFKIHILKELFTSTSESDNSIKPTYTHINTLQKTNDSLINQLSFIDSLHTETDSLKIENNVSNAPEIHMSVYDDSDDENESPDSSSTDSDITDVLFKDTTHTMLATTKNIKEEEENKKLIFVKPKEVVKRDTVVKVVKKRIRKRR